MTGRTIAAIYPTTPAQQGYLLGTLTAPDDAVFIEQAAVPLEGDFDPGRFKAAWAELLRRHEILRTGFAWDLGDAPRQVVMSEADVPVDFVDNSGRPAAEQDRRLEQILAQQRRPPFDLTRPPLLRLTVQRRSDHAHMLVWTHHHAIMDGWSQLQLIHELITLHNDPQHAVEPSSFGTYAEWLTGRNPASDRDFWRNELDGLPAPARPHPLEVPGDLDRFGVCEVRVPDGDLDRLARFGAAHQITIASLVIAGWGLIAAQRSSASDVTIGVTVSGRSAPYPGVQSLCGPLAAAVPVRIAVDGQIPFAAWVADLQASASAAADHAATAAAEIHSYAELPADVPLYDSIVAVGNYPRVSDADAGPLKVAVDQVRGYGGRTLQPLTLVVTLSEGVTLRLVNDRTRVSDGDASAALTCLLGLLAGLPAHGGDLVAQVAEDTPRLGPVAPGPPAASYPVDPDRGTLESAVAAAYARVLGREHVPVDVDFLAAGGNSLLAVRLLAGLRDAFAVDLTLGDVLTGRTPRGVADRIRVLIADGPAPSEPLPPIVVAAADSDEPFPLTAIQQAYWVGRQEGFELGGVDAHLYGEVDIPDLDVGRLEAAWRRVISRHGMLRAVFTADGRQRILPTVPEYTIASVDLRAVAGGGVVALAEMRARLSHVRRDVGEWPLFTVEAARLPDGTTRLFLSFDLLIGDALSWKILYREIRRLYENPSAELPEVGLEFRDYAAAADTVRGTSAYAHDRDYWRQRLPSLPGSPTFPLARHPRDIGVPRFTRRQAALPGEDLETLRHIAARHGVTLSTLLMAAFSETLGHHTNSREFLINVTVFNRLPIHPHVDQIVGDFTSLLLVHVDLGSGATFADRLRSLQRRVWTDLDHRLYSGMEVLSDLRDRSGDRSAAPAPVVFTSTLDLGDGPGADARPLPGTVVYGIGQTPQVMFDYQTYEADGSLVINWDTVDALFPDGYLDCMFTEHRAVLRALLVDMSATDRADLHQPPEPPPLGEAAGGDLLLHEPFVRQAHLTPDAVAVIADGSRLTYAETYGLAAQIAAQVTALTPRGKVVAVVMDKGWEQVAAVIGTLMAGYAYVPVEMSWPPARIAEILAVTNVSVVVTHSSALPALPLRDGVSAVVADDLPAVRPGHEQAARVRGADDLAYVIFTSGSTGAPKGVMVSHRAALNTILDVNDRFAVGPGDRTLALSPFSFDLAVYDVFGILAAGGAVVVPPRTEKRDPAGWARLITSERVTVWNSVPVLMDVLADAVPAGSEALEGLRVCLLSGDWIPLSLPDRVRRLAPSSQVISLGGATEGAIWSIFYSIGDVDPAWASVPYGYPLTGQTVQVLGEDLAPCPVWVPGQIFIGGHGIADGYWNSPDLARDSFVYDRRTGRRLYRTGDWGRLRPDGAIEFLGRHDDQVKVRGFRVELREVQTAVESLPGVERAAVVATGDRSARRLAAFVVGDVSGESLKALLSERLPAHMVPSTITPVGQLPLSSTGKVDRGALIRAADALTAIPSDVAVHLHAADEVTSAVIQVVAGVLSVTPQCDADLLEYGLTSVDVIRLCNAVEAGIGVRPDVEAFYRTPTVSGLVASVSGTVTPLRRQPPAAGSPSEWSGWQVISEPDARARFRAARPNFPPPSAERTLPDENPRHMQRRARRLTPAGFSSRPVTVQQLGRMLDCLRRTDVGGRDAFLYPSAGGLYSVATYVHVRPGRVGDMRSGLYSYHPDAHDLVNVVSDFDMDACVHVGPVNRPVAETAAFTVFLVTDPRDSAPLYGEDGASLGLLNAGYMGQLLCDAASEAGLGLTPVHGVAFDAVRWLFPDGGGLVLLHTLLGGHPASPAALTRAEV